jgi:Glycosyltransferase family 87
MNRATHRDATHASAIDADVYDAPTPSCQQTEPTDAVLEAPSTPAAAMRARPASAPTRKVRSLLLFLGLLLLAAALRIPTFGNHVFNTDEAYLATEGQILQHGGHLYVDAVDRKPPLVPYLYAATLAVTGNDDLVSVRVLAVLAHALTALLLGAEARRRFGRDWSGAAAGVLYLLAATAFRTQDAQAANFEVFMLPLMTGAMVLGIRRRPAAAGATLAVATLAKQTAVLTLLPLAWLAWRARRASGVLTLLASFIVPIVLVAAALGFHDFLFWNLTGNGGYLDASGVLGYALGLGARQTAWFLFGHAVIVVLAALAWRHRRDDTDLWLWLLSGLAAVVVGLRFFPHYYLQLLPPLCLLATRALSSWKVLTRPWITGGMLVIALGTTSYYLVPAFNSHDGRNAKIAYAVARYVGHQTGPGDRVLVWGHAPEVYWSSGRLPATRFVTTGFLTGASGGRPPDRVGMQYATTGAWEMFIHDLRRHPPTLVVDMATADQRNARFYPPRRFPDFERYLRIGGYRRVAVVAGASIYRMPTSADDRAR